MLVLLSGAVGSGKTTLCTELAAVARDRGLCTGGVLTPAIIERGAKVGIEALDLRSGERRLLARTDREIGTVRVGRYALDEQTLEWMCGRCAAALTSKALVMVDEIGPLELEDGMGLAPLIPLLIHPRGGHTVVVVRHTLLAHLADRLSGAMPRVVVLDPARRHRARAALRATLFPSE